MLYVEYCEAAMKDELVRGKLEALLTIREELFARTQPKGIAYDKDKVTNGAEGNVFDAYMIAKEKLDIDKRIDDCFTISSHRARLAAELLERLKKSTDPNDRIFLGYYLNREKVYEIAKNIGYSERSVYRRLSRVVREVEDCRKRVKNGSLWQ